MQEDAIFSSKGTLYVRTHAVRQREKRTECTLDGRVRRDRLTNIQTDYIMGKASKPQAIPASAAFVQLPSGVNPRVLSRMVVVTINGSKWVFGLAARRVRYCALFMSVSFSNNI